ncbi:ribonuclease P protein component [Candidatus Nomurabacteria bacterium]|nr:ribonuclease P protein component [Candidatus Nomurabacteria bacterium]
MLSKNKRVTKDIFQTILKKGNIISGSFFLFRYTSLERRAYSFVVAKKIASKAVKRNSLRRIGYNILRKYTLKPVAGVFFYKKEALIAEPEAIKNDIESILKRAKLI